MSGIPLVKTFVRIAEDANHIYDQAVQHASLVPGGSGKALSTLVKPYQIHLVLSTAFNATRLHHGYTAKQSVDPFLPPQGLTAGTTYNPFGPDDGDTGPQTEAGRQIPIDEFIYQQLVINNVCVCAVTLFAWEFLTTLPAEWQLYWRMGRRSVQTWLFALVRYGTLPSLILPAYSTWHDFSDAGRSCLTHQQEATAVVQLIVSIVFVWRTSAIWDRDKRVIAGLSFLVMVQFATSFAILWYTRETLLSNGNCMPLPAPGKRDIQAYFYLCAFIFDSITIGLSFWRLAYFSDLPISGKVPNNPSSREETQNEKDAREGTEHRNPFQVALGLRKFPVRFFGHVMRRWESMTLTPLLGTLSRNGLIYWSMAGVFNLANFGLEISNSIHSKALISLYAPVMCILCQRIILTESKAIFGKKGKRTKGSTSRAHGITDSGFIGLGVTSLPREEKTPAREYPATPSIHGGAAMDLESGDGRAYNAASGPAANKARKGSTSVVGALFAERRHDWEGSDGDDEQLADPHAQSLPTSLIVSREIPLRRTSEPTTAGQLFPAGQSSQRQSYPMASYPTKSSPDLSSDGQQSFVDPAWWSRPHGRAGSSTSSLMKPLPLAPPSPLPLPRPRPSTSASISETAPHTLETLLADPPGTDTHSLRNPLERQQTPERRPRSVTLSSSQHSTPNSRPTSATRGTFPWRRQQHSSPALPLEDTEQLRQPRSSCQQNSSIPILDESQRAAAIRMAGF